MKSDWRLTPRSRKRLIHIHEAYIRQRNISVTTSPPWEHADSLSRFQIYLSKSNLFQLTVFRYPILKVKVGTKEILSVRNSVVDLYNVQIFLLLIHVHNRSHSFNSCTQPFKFIYPEFAMIRMATVIIRTPIVRKQGFLIFKKNTSKSQSPL